VLSGIMISMGRILEKLGPKSYITGVRGKGKFSEVHGSNLPAWVGP
jgi:hypothetical protein